MSAVINQPRTRFAQQISTRVAFFIAGFAIGAWAPLVPYAKERVQLDEGALGLLLLCLGMGSLLTMPFTGMLAGRFGCRIVIICASIVVAVVLPLLASLSSPWGLATALFLFGAGVGTVDVAVNIQAVVVEKESGRSLMSGFHGLYSVGGLVGAAAVSGLLWLQLGTLNSTLFVSGVILLLLVGFSKNLLSSANSQQEPFFVLPRGPVRLMAVLCFLLFLTEGSVLDWSAVFLTSVRDVPTAYAGLGYAAFSVAMTVGRLTGDALVQALGAKRILQVGGITAIFGLAMAIVVPIGWVGMLGFVFVGLGASNLVPVIFSMAGRQNAMPSSSAIAAITTIGYSGILCGPALIGFIAQKTSLSIALGLVAIALLAIPLAAISALPLPTRSEN